MKTLILCGGKGTRLSARAESLPKALVEIGGRPVIWHIMKIYESHGFADFVLLLGYQGNSIKEHFVYRDAILSGDIVLDTAADGPGRLSPMSHEQRDRFRITFADTGLETPTGGRIKKAAKYVGGETFLATYGDGVADVDLQALLAYHRSHGRIGTVTVVHPWSQFGEVVVGADDRVREFREKPRMEKWVNGGFFVFEPAFFDYLREDDVLERAPLEKLAADNQLCAFRHEGFWQCMDTFKDAASLNDLWDKGAPWKVWK